MSRFANLFLVFIIGFDRWDGMEILLGPCLQTLDGSSYPHIENILVVQVCKVTFKHLSQPLRSHMQSFELLRQLLKTLLYESFNPSQCGKV